MNVVEQKKFRLRKGKWIKHCKSNISSGSRVDQTVQNICLNSKSRQNGSKYCKNLK